MNPEYSIIIINWLTEFFRNNDLLLALISLLVLAVIGFSFCCLLYAKLVFNEIEEDTWLF